ncbi:MAG: FHA domain-containing protein [Myxococcota bacterium]
MEPRSPLPGSGFVELVVSRPDHPDRRLLLKPGVVLLGRAEDNDLVLPDIGVSRRHARIIVDSGGVIVEDLGSGNGTLYQGRPLRKKRIEDGDVLQIEPFVLQFRVSNGAPGGTTGGGIRVPASHYTNPGSVAPQVMLLDPDNGRVEEAFTIPSSGLTMGRALEQDIVLNDPGASRSHAVIMPRQGGYWLEDNGSANGTFVNDERVYQQMLQNGDVIRVGTTALRFEAVGQGVRPDPLSRLWDESGIRRRPHDTDPEHTPKAPSFLPPRPPRPPPRPPFGEETTAAHPDGRSSQGRALFLAGGLLFGLVIVVIVGVSFGPRLIQQMTAPANDLEPVLDLPTPITDEAGARLMLGHALLKAQRPLEAATPLYQARKMAPDAEEVQRLGYVACEQAVLQALHDDLRYADLPVITAAERRGLVRSADRIDDEMLPELRTRLVEQLHRDPGDDDASAALTKVDSRLAGLASAMVLELGDVSGSDAWQTITQASALAPHSRPAAEAAWKQIAAAESGARAQLQQAVALDVAGDGASAAALYAQVIDKIPGEDAALEQIARIRRDALAP